MVNNPTAIHCGQLHTLTAWSAKFMDEESIMDTTGGQEIPKTQIMKPGTVHLGNKEKFLIHFYTFPKGLLSGSAGI